MRDAGAPLGRQTTPEDEGRHEEATPQAASRVAPTQAQLDEKAELEQLERDTGATGP
jgi:hypothetical protein